MRHFHGILFAVLGFATTAFAQTEVDAPRGPGEILTHPLAIEQVGQTEPGNMVGNVPVVSAPVVIASPASLPVFGAPPRPERGWVGLEYLMWYIAKDQAPVPLLTVGSPADPVPGAIGQGGTHELFDTNLNYQVNNGFRVSLGRSLDENGDFAVELAAFMLETHTIHHEGESDDNGAPLLARPYFDARNGATAAMIITTPLSGGVKGIGGIDIFADSRTWGGEINLWTTFLQQGNFTLRFSSGFRYLGQKDQLRFDQTSIPTYTGAPAGPFFFGGSVVQGGDALAARDYYETLNHFYGLQGGVKGVWNWGRWGLEVISKAGAGVTDQRLEMRGNTRLWILTPGPNAGAVLTLPGGLFVQPSNMGSYQREQLSFMTEANIRLTCQCTRRLRALVGYSFLYWNSVVRPAANIDANVDPRQLASSPAYDPNASPAQPANIFRATDFWAQGLNCALEFHY